MRCGSDGGSPLSDSASSAIGPGSAEAASPVGAGSVALRAGLLLALSYLGGDAAQIRLGLPNAVTGIFQGILLFCLLGCDVLLLNRVRWRPARTAA